MKKLFMGLLVLGTITTNAFSTEYQYSDVVGTYEVSPKTGQFTKHTIKLFQNGRISYTEDKADLNSCEGKLDIQRCYSNECLIVRSADIDCTTADGEVIKRAMGYEIVFRDSVNDLSNFQGSVSIGPFFTGQGNFYEVKATIRKL